MMNDDKKMDIEAIRDWTENLDRRPSYVLEEIRRIIDHILYMRSQEKGYTENVKVE